MRILGYLHYDVEENKEVGEIGDSVRVKSLVVETDILRDGEGKAGDSMRVRHLWLWRKKIGRDL